MIVLNPVRTIHVWVKLLSLYRLCPTSLRPLLALSSSKLWYTSLCPQESHPPSRIYASKPREPDLREPKEAFFYSLRRGH